MKPMTAFVFSICAAVAPAAIAQQSLPDSNPECMRVNDPDCVLQSVTVPVRVAPPATLTKPVPVVPVVVPVPAPIEFPPVPPVVIAPAPTGPSTGAPRPATEVPRPGAETPRPGAEARKF